MKNQKIGTMLAELFELVEARRLEPVVGSYTNYLLERGPDKICEKLGGETVELILAYKNNAKDVIAYEAADLLYHLTVLLAEAGVNYDEVFEELKTRR